MSEISLIYKLDAPPWSQESRPKQKLTPLRCPWACRVKARIPYIDYDYTKKLSKEEYAFLRKFSDEYYGAGFTDNPLHQEKKDCESRNNQMNRCIHSRTQLMGLIYYQNLSDLERFITSYDLQIWDIDLPEPSGKKGGYVNSKGRSKLKDSAYIDFLKQKGLV